MEGSVWIEFVDGEEPEEQRPLPDGRYEAVIQVEGTARQETWPKRLRKDRGDWCWDWGVEDPDERLLINPGRERILRARRIGDLYPPRSRADR